MLRLLLVGHCHAPSWLGVPVQRWFERLSRLPGGSTDDAAKVSAVKMRFLVREDVSFNVAEGGLGLAMDAVVEGLDDLFLEAGRARVRVDNGFALGVGKLGICDTEDVHLDAGGDERDDRTHTLWDAGRRVQRDRGPDCLDIPLGDATAFEEIAGGVGAVHLEALVRAGMRGGEAHIVKHGAGVQELGIVAEATAVACKRTPVVDAARVMKQYRRLGISDQFRYFTSQLAVGNDDA